MAILYPDSAHDKSDDDLLRETLGKVANRAGVESGYLRKYGITSQDYWLLYHKQHGVCAVCGQPETAKRGNTTRMLCVDHSHLDGKVRGLLCSACNTALGMLKEDTQRMHSLIAYTEKWQGLPAKPIKSQRMSSRRRKTRQSLINAGQMTLFDEGKI